MRLLIPVPWLPVGHGDSVSRANCKSRDFTVADQSVAIQSTLFFWVNLNIIVNRVIDSKYLHKTIYEPSQDHEPGIFRIEWFTIFIVKVCDAGSVDSR
jgi:hypothetical protein